LEDLAAVDLADVRAVLAETRVRLLGALRLTADDLPELLEILFLRVFCDTACARNNRAPVQCFHENPSGPKKRRREQGSACWMCL